MNNKDDFFLKQMKGVSPIKKNNKVKKEVSKTKIKKLKKNITISKNSNSLFERKTTAPDFSLERLDIKKNIKKGSIKINKKIDFHGQNLLESEEVFKQTITDCYNSGERCLLFITGKGLFRSKKEDDEDRPRLYNGIIRSEFLNWVKSKKFSKQILSYERASSQHGGDGAFYVYLRKRKN